MHEQPVSDTAPRHRPAPPVLITRVRDEAEPWARGLAEAGLQAELLPLIEIGPAPDAGALRAAWAGAGDHAALMFVSASAVRRFFAAATADGKDHGLSEAGGGPGPWPNRLLPVRCWATGPGTQRALIECGCPASQIDAPGGDAAQFDSEALWTQVQPQVRAGTRVLIVRGADVEGRIAGRDWLALQLEAAGVRVDQVAAYARVCPPWDAAQRQRAQQAAHDGSWWWFSSSEAIANLRSLLPQASWAAARALTTHPRIADAARQAGFGQVLVCRATVADLIASIKSVA